ncbi:MAG: hypothetical protein AB7E72_16190, partial [Lysobacterales bacterium]
MPLDLQLLRKDFTDQQIVDNFGNQLGIDVQKMRADKISDTVIAENLAAQYDSLIASKSAPKPDQGGAGPAIKPVSLEDTFTTQQVLNPAADAPDAANRQILKEKGFAAASADARAGMKARKAEDKAAFDKANAAAKKGEGYTERSREEVWSDAGIAGKQGLLNVMGSASWLVDKLPGIDTDGFTTAMLEAAKAEEANKSAETQIANRRVQKAEGMAETLDALLDDPMAIADMVFQSAPIMLPGMAIGSVAARVAARSAATKAIAAGATKEAARAAAAKAAMTAAAVGGVAGEGAISGGMSGAQTEAEIKGMSPDNLEKVSARYRELNLSMSPEEARDQLAAEVSLVTAVATGGATAGLGIAADKVLKLAGLGDPYSGALLKRLSATQAGKNVLAEVGQEIPQSMGEQVAGNLTNVDDSKEWSEDVGKAGVMGAVGAIGQSGAMQAGGAALRATGLVPTIDDTGAPPAPAAPSAAPAAPVAPVNPAATGISPAGVPPVEALQAQADSAVAKSQELAALADEARGMGNTELANQYEAESAAAAADAKQALDTITVEHTGLQGVVNRTGVAALPLSADELAKGQIDAGNRAALGLDQLRDDEELQPVAPADDGTLAANVQTLDTTPTVNVAPEADPVGPAGGLAMATPAEEAAAPDVAQAAANHSGQKPENQGRPSVASQFYIKNPETGEDVPVESIEDADRKFKALIASTGADFEGGMDVFDATTNQPVANLKASGKPTRVETADEKRARSAEDIAKMTALERVEPAAENEQALSKRMAYLRGAITASSDDKFKASAKDELKQITSKINALKGKAPGRAERVNALGDDNADTSPMVPRDKRDDPEAPTETENQKSLRIA